MLCQYYAMDIFVNILFLLIFFYASITVVLLLFHIINKYIVIFIISQEIKVYKKSRPNEFRGLYQIISFFRQLPFTYY
jgi:hypothetical protein